MKHVNEQERVIKCQSPVISLRGYHGTGKTTTIAKFILSVLLTGMDKKILAVTLTKLAAANLKDELHKSPDWDSRFDKQIRVGTFHSFVVSYVRKFAKYIRFDSNFAIDKDINDKVLRKLIKDKRFVETDKPLETLKDLYRDYVRSGRKIQKIVNVSIDDPKDSKLAARIMKKLKAEKVKMNIMDFDDILYYFYKLCKKEPMVTEAIVYDFSPRVVVDEFQDTIVIQWKIMKLLIKAGIRFLGADDPFQTLFRYAGASLKRFDHLKAIDGCKGFELTENHRTT
jgi:DNA helicase-2/ATP-dependent DNA helicase PcrA